MSDDPGNESGTVIEQIEQSRQAEKIQALHYRALASLAEDEDSPLAQRFHDLHADEQHHLSRLTARILELGGKPRTLNEAVARAETLNGWEESVRVWETAEVDRYSALLAGSADVQTLDLYAEILNVEEHHLEHLGGKWTIA